MNKIKKGDEVIVIAGKDKGKRGTVLSVVKKGERLLVDGINLVKKHVKPNPYKNTQGGIIEREAAIHLSNLALLNPITNKADKVGIKFIESNTPGEKPRKVRYFKSNNEMVDAVE